MTQSFFKKADGAIVVFDVTDKASFDQVAIWMEALTNKGTYGCQKIVVGNKIDLDDERAVTRDEGQALANRYADGLYFETSALTGYNIMECDDYIACACFDKLESDSMQIQIEDV